MKSVIKTENKLSNIESVLDEIENAGLKNNISDTFVFQIKLCLDEVLTNIISYGFNDSNTHIIQIEYEITNEKFSANIMDDGKEFNPLESEDPDLDSDISKRKIGGLGIFLVKNFMTEINYKRKQNKNILSLSKNFNENNGD